MSRSRRSARFADPPLSSSFPSSSPTGSESDTDAPLRPDTVLSSLITGSSSDITASNVFQADGTANGVRKPQQPPAIVLPVTAPVQPSVSAPSATINRSMLTPPTALSLASPNSPSLRALWMQAKTEASEGRAYWTEEQYVEDITVSFLYQPHTVIALTVLIGYMLYVAFYRFNDSSDIIESLRAGCSVAAMFIVILGLVVFPSGPFVRPHPLLWRFAFSLAVLYEIVLIMLLFLSKQNARAALTFFDPSLNVPLKERAYAEDCAFTFNNLYAGFVDMYALSHFLGWVVKSLILRDTLLCWVISVQWELLEIAFTHWLPNFAECWWDQWLLDVLICNGLGIEIGRRLCDYLEMKEYHWRGFMHIPSWSGRLHRAVLQFTPQSWQKVRWDASSSLRMFFFLQFLVLVFHWEEMNAFMLKHLLWIPPPCPLNVVRLVIWGFVGVPSLRQAYSYMTDPTCKRIGTQTFLVLLMLVTESFIIVKMSPGEFTGKHMKEEVAWMWRSSLVLWLLFNAYYIRKILRHDKRHFFADGDCSSDKAHTAKDD